VRRYLRAGEAAEMQQRPSRRGLDEASRDLGEKVVTIAGQRIRVMLFKAGLLTPRKP
jgi:hypothetical protein